MIEIAASSTPGSVHEYEDRILIEEGKSLFAVADGVTRSSQGSGAVAAELALKLLRESYSGDLSAAIQKAQEGMVAKRIGDRTVGETTLTAAVTRKGVLEVGNVGDSPAYLTRGERIRSLFHPDTSPQGYITQVMGHPDTIEVNMTRTRLQEHDVVILASDGVGHVLNSKLLLTHIRKESAEELANWIITEAQVRSTGYDDDKSVIVLRILSVD